MMVRTFFVVFCVLVFKIFCTRRRPEMKRKKSTAKRFLECLAMEQWSGLMIHVCGMAYRFDGHRLWVGFQRDRITDKLLVNRSNSFVVGDKPHTPIRPC